MNLFQQHKSNDWVSGLRKQDSASQKMFYEKYSQKFLYVAKAYVKDIYLAEDCLIKAFCKIFKNINSLKNDDAIEGWARRIVVNECLSFLKTHKTLFYIDENDVAEPQEEETGMEYDFNAQELLGALPESYRLVFNLHILEDYGHQEIAEMLNISVSASKTQLFRAKAKLKELVQQKKQFRNEI